jgi:hypothetical protein
MTVETCSLPGPKSLTTWAAACGAPKMADRAGAAAEANHQRERSLAFWRSVGATRYLRRSEPLLATAS